MFIISSVSYEYVFFTILRKLRQGGKEVKRGWMERRLEHQ